MSANEDLPRVLVMLPAYNEAEAIEKLLHNLDVAFRQYGFRGGVLVVNDGSKDATSELAKAFRCETPVEVYDQIPNQGLAQVMRTGFRLGLERCRPQDVLIVMDGDNTHPTGLMAQLFQLIMEGADVAIASRYRPGASVRGLSGFRKLLSLGASWLMRFRARVPGVRDYTCGYRAYRAAFLARAVAYYGGDYRKFIRQEGFACMAEILIKFKPLKPIIREAPMILRYDWKEGESKMRIFRTVKQTLGMIVRGK